MPTKKRRRCFSKGGTEGVPFQTGEDVDWVVGLMKKYWRRVRVAEGVPFQTGENVNKVVGLMKKYWRRVFRKGGTEGVPFQTGENVNKVV